MHISQTSQGETVITFGVGRVTCVVRGARAQWSLSFHVPNESPLLKKRAPAVGEHCLLHAGLVGKAYTMFLVLHTISGHQADAILEATWIAEQIEKGEFRD